MKLDPLALLESQLRELKENFGAQLPPLLMWGDYIFQLSTMPFNKMTLTDGWTWAVQGRIAQSEQLQYTGKKTPAIRFECELYDDFVDTAGLDEMKYALAPGVYVTSDPVEMLRRQANANVPLLLVTGYGVVLGEWVMTAMEQNIDEFRGAGEYRHQTVTVSMLYYGPGNGPSTIAPVATSAHPVLDEIKNFFGKVKDNVVRFI